MNTVLFVIGLACAFAAPAPESYVVSKSPAIQFSRSNTDILSQISQHNEDGSYTFGYESADGSFRVENRDIDGFVTGKYGYVDPTGEVHEFEYVAGSTNGRALGYQVRGTGLTEANRAQVFPSMYSSVSSSDQRVRDFAYSSVDDNADGFPDNIFDGSFGVRDKGQPTVVRLNSAQTQSALENPSPILRVVNTAKISNQQASVVRVSSPSQASLNNPSNVRIVDPVQVSQPRPSVVRVTSADQSTLTEPFNNGRLVNPVQISNQQQVVRLVNPVQISNQQQIVRLTSPKTKTVIQPARVSGGNYQVIQQQQRQRQPQLVQSVSRNPYYITYGGQRFTSRSRPSIYSSGRINSFLSGRATAVRDNYGRWMTRGNNQQASFVPSAQTVFIDADDIDDLNDFDDDFDDIFDDDDTFIVDSSSLMG